MLDEHDGLITLSKPAHNLAGHSAGVVRHHDRAADARGTGPLDVWDLGGEEHVASHRTDDGGGRGGGGGGSRLTGGGGRGDRSGRDRGGGGEDPVRDSPQGADRRELLHRRL